MEPEQARAAAEHLRDARRDHRRLDALPEHCRPRTVDDGYRVQDALVALLDDPIVGWKIGSTSKRAQQIVGTTEPFAARLRAPCVHPGPARLAADAFFMRALEAEFAFRLGADLAEGPFDRATVAAAVAALHPAIEISDSRFADWTTAGAPSLIADNGNEGQVVLGPEIADWRGVDLPAHAVALCVNGETAAEGTGANVLDDPLLALAWLAEDRARRGGRLEAGQVVITGSCTGVTMAEAGDSVAADFGALGVVELHFT